jgi:glyoxylase-like metal-dependent hydrolase (beta-lactamase superfamily II)
LSTPTPPFSTTVKFDLLRVGHCQHPECVALRCGGRRAIDFPALVGLIEHPRLGLMLYDTGYSRRFHAATRRFPECLYRLVTPVTLPPEEELLAQLEARHIRAGDVGLIIISHFHADHVAGLRDFPNARFIAIAAERARYARMGRVGQLRRGFLPALLPDDLDERLTVAENVPKVVLPAAWRPFEAAQDLLGDGSLLGVDLPGHTASQLGLALQAEQPFFLVGDACWKIEGLRENRKPSRMAYTLFDSGADYDAIFDGLRRFEAARIIPSHCSTTWRELGGCRRIHRD